MKKKILLIGGTIIAITAGIIGMSAFEAHVINVTAKIENALKVDTTPLEFGTVFPQEAFDKTFDMQLSESFLAQDRTNTVNYILRQKPKCYSESEKKYGLITENANQEFICADGGDYEILPVLCPYLSKHEITTDGETDNDSAGINAFHGPATGWTLADTLATEVSGQLANSSDISDQWNIDFRVPCFGGQCAQDWDEFVIKNNPDADPDSYILPIELEHKLFGCDLWVEVTGIYAGQAPVCVPNCQDKNCGDDGCGGNCGSCTADQVCIAGICTANDIDSDGIADLTDNCPTASNLDQADADDDGLGDACDPDIDGDGDLNAADCAPTEPLISSGATENCSDGVDNNCNGYVDCGDTACLNDSACQTPTNGHHTMRLENKTAGWDPIIDDTYADLNYNQSGPTFDWTLNVVGVSANTQYRLAYIPDPWPQGLPVGGPYTIKTEIKTFTTNSSGAYNGSGSTELNLDLPDSRDANYGINYAKVWIVPANIHNAFYMTGRNMPVTLFDTQSVNYDDTDVPSSRTISLNDLGAASQYGYYHDYSGANVTFTYTTPAVDKLSGTITATGLKPYATYQLKFDGQPTCKYGAAGNDLANEYIGYQGRWWDNTNNANTTDAGYEANHTTHCITGYLVWGYITADAGGNASQAVTTDSSYHVLWCGGGTCGTSNNIDLVKPDPAHPAVNFCQPADVNGQLERGGCGSMTLNAGNYKLGLSLTEESFHQGPGTWTTVMNGNIEFKIN